MLRTRTRGGIPLAGAPLQRPAVDRAAIGRAIDWLRSHFDAAQFGIASPKHVDVKGIVPNAFFQSSTSVAIDDKELVWVSTAFLTALGVRAAASNIISESDFYGIHYEFGIEGTSSGHREERRFAAGASTTVCAAVIPTIS